MPVLKDLMNKNIWFVKLTYWLELYSFGWWHGGFDLRDLTHIRVIYAFTQLSLFRSTLGFVFSFQTDLLNGGDDVIMENGERKVSVGQSK